jgi:hypothetical protein
VRSIELVPLSRWLIVDGKLTVHQYRHVLDAAPWRIMIDADGGSRVGG